GSLRFLSRFPGTEVLEAPVRAQRVARDQHKFIGCRHTRSDACTLAYSWRYAPEALHLIFYHRDVEVAGPVPLIVVDDDAAQSHLESPVFHLTNILCQGSAANVGWKRLVQQQVGRVFSKIIGLHGKPAGEEAGLQAHINLFCCLPTKERIAWVAQHNTADDAGIIEGHRRIGIIGREGRVWTDSLASCLTPATPQLK